MSAAWNDLPFIDRHSQDLDIDEGALRGRLPGVVARQFQGVLVSLFVALLGCHDRKPLAGMRMLPFGEHGPLVLLGQHRFSRYALRLHIEALPGGRSRLSAETRAEFPGRVGALYRLLVISSGVHVLAVRAILWRLKRQL